MIRAVGQSLRIAGSSLGLKNRVRGEKGGRMTGDEAREEYFLFWGGELICNTEEVRLYFIGNSFKGRT